MRATAIDHRNSSVGQASSCCMPVRGLGKKFCTITSCTCPRPLTMCAWCESRIATKAAIRSARVSPMPTKIPVVNGICNSPAKLSVAKRRSGSLSGAPRWQAKSWRNVSTIIPWLGEKGRKLASSSLLNAPALAWGSNPVSSSTNLHIATRYSVVDA